MDMKLRRRKANINNKSLLVSICFFLLTIISLGFAYLESKLTLNGNMAITKGAWDVHFENLAVSGGSVSTTNPAKINEDKRKITFSVNFTDVSQYYQFEVDVVNAGAIDAMVGDITLSGLPDSLKKIMEYNIAYSDGIVMNKNDLLKIDTSERLKIKLRFKDGATTLGVHENFTLTLEIPYVQATEVAVEREKAVVKGNMIQVLELDKSVPNDSTVAFGSPSSSINGKGLLVRSGTESYEYPIYYYRGNIIDNNVLFADLCWKIVRTTESGGTKLIYNGVPNGGKCHSTEVSIGQSEFNSTKSDAKYVGYMFNGSLDINSSEEIVNTTDSAIKEMLDNWYKEKLIDYDSYLEDAIWCNDRVTESSGATISFAPIEVRGLNSTSPTPEIIDSKLCTRKIDRFTKSSSIGNGKLQYSIGLLTADEVLVAGNGIDGGNTYLTEANAFWTMTPSLFASRSANIFGVYEDGALDGVNVNDDAMDVRPSIVLKEGTMVYGGNGTVDNPYIV